MAASEQRLPQHSRGLSFGNSRSDKSSRRSTESKNKKMSLVETSKEKAANRMHTHADPTIAMSEAQPSAIALEKSNLDSLRSVQHKDLYGNWITEPDLSNPTRHRFERPLDTIKSFEAAIDGTYNTRRLSYARPDESTNGHSRPTSYFGDRGGHPNHHNRAHNDQNGYYGNRGYQSRPESYVDTHGGSNFNQYQNSQQQQPRVQRHGSRDQWNYGQNQPGSHPLPGFPQPNENGHGSPSGSNNQSLQWANSTDPSSVNSSMDRLQQQLQHGQGQRKPEEQLNHDSYGFSGFGTDPQLDRSQPHFQGYGQEGQNHHEPSNGLPSQQNGNGFRGQEHAPKAPPKDLPIPSSIVPKGASKFLQKEKAPATGGEKRKSWFKRRISKS